MIWRLMRLLLEKVKGKKTIFATTGCSITKRTFLKIYSKNVFLYNLLNRLFLWNFQCNPCFFPSKCRLYCFSVNLTKISCGRFCNGFLQRFFCKGFLQRFFAMDFRCTIATPLADLTKFSEMLFWRKKSGVALEIS